MLRKILLILLTIAIIGAAVYSYYSFRQIKQPVSEAIHAIPLNAAVVVEGNDFPGTWKKLSSGNIIWEALKSSDYFTTLNNDLSQLDSIYSSSAELQKAVVGKQVYAAAVQSGAQDYHFLFVMSMPADGKPEFVDQLFTQNKVALQNKSYDGAAIKIAAVAHERKFSYTIHKGLLLGSFSLVLVEDAVRQLNAGASLADNAAFSRVKETSGAHNAVNILVNHKTLPSLLGTYLNPEAQDLLLSMSDFSTWSELDLKVKSNYLMLNGFSLAPDTLNKYLSLFGKQKPQDVDATGVMSYRTATFVHFGFSNYKKFRTDFQDYLQRNNQLMHLAAYIADTDQAYGCDLLENMLSWLEYELVFYTIEPGSAEFDNQLYALLRTRDPGASAGNLTDLSVRVATVRGNEPFVENYRDYEIRQIDLPELFPKLFGPLCNQMTGNYFTFIDQYVLFANTPASLREAINDYLGNHTLAKDINFVDFSDNLSEESNILLYSNIARSPYIYQSFAKDNVGRDIELQIDLFRQFEAVAIQISADRGNMFYNNIFLKHNPVYKQETKSLWETRLDTAIHMKPQLVVNHYTKVDEVFVQDEANAAYLLSNTGKVLWKVQLDGQIMGDVTQIDVIRNDKFQMLFNTKDKLYLLDRNGRHVDGFPVKLPAKATAQHIAMDYEKNRDYRILLPTADGNLQNYDRFGKPVKGWNFSRSRSPIQRQIQHFSLDGKDYLIGVDTRGNVHILNRKGETRLNIGEKLPVSKNNRIYIDVGSSLAKTFLVTTDSSGNVLRLNLEGDLENIHLDDFSSNHYFYCADLNNDGNREYILADSNQMAVYEDDKSILFDHLFETSVSEPIQLFTYPGNKKELAVVTGRSNQVYLISSQGIIRENFPLFGSTLVAVGDMNRDGTYTLVTGNSDNNIYTYSLNP